MGFAITCIEVSIYQDGISRKKFAPAHLVSALPERPGTFSRPSSPAVNSGVNEKTPLRKTEVGFEKGAGLLACRVRVSRGN
jgi:hypothetical protein